MKKLAFVFLFIQFIQGCTKMAYEVDTKETPFGFDYNHNHPLKDSIDRIISHHINKGLPGIQVIIKNKDGWYLAADGLKSIEKRSPMNIHMTSWLYSISKIYTATLVLYMTEKNVLKLDEPINAYLSPGTATRIPHSGEITVRMLLNHTSGIRNFTVEPAYQLRQFNSPLNQPSLSEQLEFIYEKPLLFDPGTDFYYSNTNYILLQYILEMVSGKSYKNLLTGIIIKPLSLNHTFFEISDQELVELGAPNFYFERYNNGQLENITTWNNAIGQSLKGYGGIVAHGVDVIAFYSALLQGKILSANSLLEMQRWIVGKGHEEADYGLGLEYFEYVKGVPTFGHEGDNIGGTTEVLYIPSNDTYIFISINAGRQLFGKYLFKTSEAKIDLCTFLSKTK